MSFLSSLFAAIIPMLLYLVFIWQFDKYEREPFSKVFKHFLWGAIGAIFFGVLLSTFLNFGISIFTSNKSLIIFASAVIVAPIAEEIVKSLYLFRSYKKNFFDNFTDGLVYGGAIGLGFGMTENLMYFTTYDETFIQWATLVVTRSIFSAVMHAISTATVGAFLAKSKFSLSPSRFLYPFVGLTLAILFHAIWNFSLSFEFTYYFGILFMIFLIVSFIVIFKSSLQNEKHLIVRELSDESNILYFGHENSKTIGTLKNISMRFSDKRVRKKYVNLATKLAFRKFQSKNSFGLQQENYISDIQIYREKLKDLVKSNPT